MRDIESRPRSSLDARAITNAVAITLLALALAGDIYVRWTHTGPDIVVYLDKDAKQPATLPLPTTTTVTGDRAALWWSVFNKTVEKGTAPWDARYVAASAVESVYGNPK